MDLKIRNLIQNLPIFGKEPQKSIELVFLGEESISEEQEKAVLSTAFEERKEEKRGENFPLEEEGSFKYLIEYGKMKYLLNVGKTIARKELNAWLTMTEKNLSTYRPDIYYIDPTFRFIISQFYEGYTSFDKLQLSLVDKEIISKYLLEFTTNLHSITNDEIDVKAVIRNAFMSEIDVFCKEGTLEKEEIDSLLSFVNQMEFESNATYNHHELSMENILYNPETKDTKIIHMQQAKYGEAIYDYIYMIKTIDKEISNIFLPFIQEADPKVVQVVSFLCDMKIYHKKKKKKENVQIELQNIHDQIRVLKEQLAPLKR